MRGLRFLMRLEEERFTACFPSNISANPVAPPTSALLMISFPSGTFSAFIGLNRLFKFRMRRLNPSTRL